MAQYTKATDGNGTVRYKDGSKFVGQADVPDNIKEALANAPEGTIIDELGDVVDPTTESDEGSEDEDLAPADPAKSDDTTEDTTTVEDQGDSEPASDPTPEPAQEPTPEPEQPEPEAPSEPSEPEEGDAPEPKADTVIGGMGFPARDGKTLSIFSDAPHETVKNVGGIMVPLTQKEFATKGDAEIIAKLKELGKI